MELRHLRAFVAVAEERSITRAAARLFVAQPAVSRQLVELERHVGVQLFTRHADGTRLTDGGRLLLAQARDILERVARMSAPTWPDADPDDRTGRADKTDQPSP